VLAEVAAPVTALIAADDEEGSRAAALVDANAARLAAGRSTIRVVPVGPYGHNLMRYRPEAVGAAILSADDPTKEGD
jgi:hypothetical protein